MHDFLRWKVNNAWRLIKRNKKHPLRYAPPFKGGFFSERAGGFVISPSRRTKFFSWAKILNSTALKSMQPASAAAVVVHSKLLCTTNAAKYYHCWYSAAADFVKWKHWRSERFPIILKTLLKDVSKLEIYTQQILGPMYTKWWSNWSKFKQALIKLTYLIILSHKSLVGTIATFEDNKYVVSQSAFFLKTRFRLNNCLPKQTLREEKNS